MEDAPVAAVPVLLALLGLVPLLGISSGAVRLPAAATEVPGLIVAVSLSPPANRALVSRRETLIVAAELTGFPQPGTPKQFIDGEGQLDLGNVTTEILPGQNGVFKSFFLKTAPLRHTDKRGPQLLINVYSGRKSSPNNLIDCGIYEGPLRRVENKTIPIACKLIGE